MNRVVLHQFIGGYGVSSYSPFCLKLETFLKMGEVPYEVNYTLNFKKAPKQKLPYITHNQLLISDSGFVIDYLKQTFDVDPDSFLDARQRADALAWSRLIEEHTYWVLLYSRWLDPQNDPILKQDYFRDFPNFLKSPILMLIRPRIRRDMFGQGLGRHSQSELYELGCRDMSALSDFLGDKTYFFGDQPAGFDAVAHAFLANLLYVPFVSPVRDHLQSLNNLVAYCRRMHERFYPDSDLEEHRSNI